MGKERTLAEHAEAWWREQGKRVPRRGTARWQHMYEMWAKCFAAQANFLVLVQVICLLLGKKNRASFFQVVGSRSDAQRIFVDGTKGRAWLSDRGLTGGVDGPRRYSPPARRKTSPYPSEQSLREGRTRVCIKR
jgi:hypothetical protein